MASDDVELDVELAGVAAASDFFDSPPLDPAPVDLPPELPSPFDAGFDDE